MLTKIIGFSVRNKLIVCLCVLGLIITGIYQARRLPIDAVPDITDNQVQVITTAPSLGATDIERWVTFPVEQAVSNIAGIHQVRSFSRFGLSLVTIVFDDNVDVYWARQQVAERLQIVREEIPADMGKPELGPITTGLGEIYQYVVKPKAGYEDRYDGIALRSIQDWIVRRQLLSVKGVAEVSSFGGKLKQYEVAIDPVRLAARNVTVDEVLRALERNNENTGGAYIERGPEILYIRSEGLVSQISDIAKIVVKTLPSGLPLSISDVATVRIGNAIRYGALTFNDQGEVAGAVVMMLKGSNSNEVIQNVKNRVEEIRKTLPEGIEIVPFLDRTKMVDNAISTVRTNLIEGALIIVFVLVFFLGNFRAGLIVASVIPLSMLFAFCMMNLFGVSGNLMSLGALDFGLIVDGAVIIVEALLHYLVLVKVVPGRHKLDRPVMDEQVVSSAGRMVNSAVFGQIIILMVYLPIFTLQGIEGKMFRPMAETVLFALLGAFLLSLTYVPVMSALFLNKAGHKKVTFSDKVIDRLSRWYRHFLVGVIRKPLALFLLIGGLLVGAFFLAGRLGGAFIPTLEEGDFAVETRLLTGSNLSNTIQYTQKAAKVLKERFPEVEMVVTKIGSGEVPTDPMPVDASDIIIVLKKKKEWTSAASFDELAEKMSKALAEETPGLITSFQFPVQMRFNELMTGARQDVVCKIYGEDLDTLSQLADKLGKIVATVPGATDVYVESVTGLPQVVIDYDRSALAQYGVDIATANQWVNTAFAGRQAGVVFEGERRYSLVLRMDSLYRSSLEDVGNLLIPTARGMDLPLRQLATVRSVSGPNQIQRDNARRRIVIGFNVRGKDMQQVVQDLQKKVGASMKLPTGYQLTYGGSFENLEQAKARLMIVVPISLFLIFVMLYFAFKSIKESVLVFSAVPLSALGGIFALSLRGMPFSISAGIGFIALFGVAVLNGIVLISEFNRLRNGGLGQTARIVIRGSLSRLRPVLITSMAASLGFLPMALSKGAGAEVQKPLATVVIGGLVTATMLTLFLLPVLYHKMERRAHVTKTRISGAGTALFLAFLLLPVFGARAQQPIGPQEAIRAAFEQNPSLLSEKFKSLYAEQLTKRTADVAPTELSVEAGQINGQPFDTRLILSQRFSLPSVYKRKQELQAGYWQEALANEALQRAIIAKRVEEDYYAYLYYRNKATLLMRMDSLYAELIERANRRFQSGESNKLELALFQNKKTTVFVGLKQANAQAGILLDHFRWLLGVAEGPVPDTAYFLGDQAPPARLPDDGHPLLKVIAAQRASNEALQKWERSRLLPDIGLGYINSSFKGADASGHILDAGDRFHALQLNIGLPLFSGSTRNRIKAGKLMGESLEYRYRSERTGLERGYAQAYLQWEEYKQICKYYREVALPNAYMIDETAREQFMGGDINYLQYVQFINEFIDVQSAYLEAVHNLNMQRLQLEYVNL